MYEGKAGVTKPPIYIPIPKSGKHKIVLFALPVQTTQFSLLFQGSLCTTGLTDCNINMCYIIIMSRPDNR